jgi:hypothetical protein
MQLNSTNTSAPAVRVIRYNACERALVQGFVDIEIDGRWRLNGLNLMRDGSMKPGQLTPMINRQRCFIDCIQVLDPDLREQLTNAILTAIHAHLETLPPEQRVKPPRPPDRRPPASQKPVPAKPQNTAPAHAKTAQIMLPAAPIQPKAVTEKPKLQPPPRLLANFQRRAQ